MGRLSQRCAESDEMTFLGFMKMAQLNVCMVSESLAQLAMKCQEHVLQVSLRSSWKVVKSHKASCLHLRLLVAARAENEKGYVQVRMKQEIHL